MSTLFVEHLTVIDCAFLDAARGLVGQSWIVDVELEGDLDPQSMVLDFGQVKRSLKRAIDSGLDHTLLVPAHASQLDLHLEGDRSELAFRAAAGAIEHRAPTQAITLIEAPAVDEATVTAHLQTSLAPVLPPNVARLGLCLRTEAIDGASYQYVHGLKKHAGQCQRIAHGHRSRVEVRVGGMRRADLEQDLAAAWTDIYLGTREDLAGRANGRLHFAYTAPEGRFELELPEASTDLLDADSTVERIAEHLAWVAAARCPGRDVEVRAYEGVMKGAVGRVRA